MQTQTSLCFARRHPDQKIPVCVRCIRSRTQAPNTETGFQHNPAFASQKLSLDTCSARSLESFQSAQTHREDGVAWQSAWSSNNFSDASCLWSDFYWGRADVQRRGCDRSVTLQPRWVFHLCEALVFCKIKQIC